MSFKSDIHRRGFQTLGEAREAVPGKTYWVFSEDELRDLNEDLQWLRLAESSFAFSDNDEDALYDNR